MDCGDDEGFNGDGDDWKLTVYPCVSYPYMHADGRQLNVLNQTIICSKIENVEIRQPHDQTGN